MPKIRGKTSRKAEVKINKKKISQPAPVVIDNFKFINDKTDREKRLLMWVGVSCLMVIFFTVWIINLKSEFKVSLNRSASSGFNWSQTKVELDKAMAQVKQGLAEIKKIQADAKPSALFGEPELTPEQINLLKGKLLNEVASSTASSTIKNLK